MKFYRTALIVILSLLVSGCSCISFSGYSGGYYVPTITVVNRTPYTLVLMRDGKVVPVSFSKIPLVTKQVDFEKQKSQPTIVNGFVPGQDIRFSIPLEKLVNVRSSPELRAHYQVKAYSGTTYVGEVSLEFYRVKPLRGYTSYERTYQYHLTPGGITSSKSERRSGINYSRNRRNTQARAYFLPQELYDRRYHSYNKSYNQANISIEVGCDPEISPIELFAEDFSDSDESSYSKSY